MNIYFNNEEYFFIKNTKLNGIKYMLYMDNNTKSKVLIIDENKNIILDKYLSNNIMSQVFRKYSEIYTDEYDEDLSIKAMNNEKPLTQKGFQNLCTNLKRMAYNQFKDILTQEEIDRRIDENLETIVIDPDLETIGQYDHINKKISLNSSNIPIEYVYHEFLHALTYPGVQKIIAFGDEESYEYGRAIDEGIIATLQKGEKTKVFTPYRMNINYPYETELLSLLKIVYENTIEAKKQNLNFFDEFIKNPNGTLERINTIFQQNEHYLLKYSNMSETDIETIGMSKALNFIVDLDEIYKEGEKEDADVNKQEELYNELRTQLEDLLIKQIQNDFPNNENELYDALFSLEGFQLKSFEKSEDIEKFKKEVIIEFLNRNKHFTIDTLEENLPPFDRQIELTNEEKGTLRLITALTKDYSQADIRCNGILKTLREVKEQLNTKNKKID